MEVLLVAIAVTAGAFAVALILNVSADRREAEVAARQREALRRARQRDCGDAR